MTDPKPVRLQRSRKKGSKLVSPNGLAVKCVTRGTRFGNPFRIFGESGYLYCLASHRRTILTPWVVFDHDQDIANNPVTPEMVIGHYRRWLDGEFDRTMPGFMVPCTVDPKELRGCNLACFCGLDAPCHADSLLELANSGT